MRRINFPFFPWTGFLFPTECAGLFFTVCDMFWAEHRGCLVRRASVYLPPALLALSSLSPAPPSLGPSPRPFLRSSDIWGLLPGVWGLCTLGILPSSWLQASLCSLAQAGGPALLPCAFSALPSSLLTSWPPSWPIPVTPLKCLHWLFRVASCPCDPLCWDDSTASRVLTPFSFLGLWKWYYQLEQNFTKLIGQDAILIPKHYLTVLKI